MDRGKAFVVVGHSDWGKSKTLKALTDDNWRIKYFEINGIKIRIKRMSNDDIPDSLIKFLKKANPDRNSIIIITLCPDFNDDSKSTIEILNSLSSKYDIHFWVIRHAYNSDRIISDDELKRLGEFGVVNIYNEIAEAEVRASTFRRYLEDNL